MTKVPDFEKIRQQVKDIIAEHGGKVEVNEWNASDGDTMKVVMTFKRQMVDMVQTASSYAR